MTSSTKLAGGCHSTKGRRAPSPSGGHTQPNGVATANAVQSDVVPVIRSNGRGGRDEPAAANTCARCGKRKPPGAIGDAFCSTKCARLHFGVKFGNEDDDLAKPSIPHRHGRQRLDPNRPKPVRKPRATTCKACGGPLDETTIGCKHCEQRAAARAVKASVPGIRTQRAGTQRTTLPDPSRRTV